MDEGRKTAKGMPKVLARILIIGFSVQIVLGVFWACLQFPHFQEFGESLFLEKVQKTLLCDEYVGILYPILMRFFSGVSNVIPLPYYCYLYALQLAVGALAAHFFLGSFQGMKGKGRLWRAWADLALVTLPMVMQCHLAVLPYSLANSLFLVHVALVMRGIAARKGVDGGKGIGNRPALRTAVMGACWLAETLLLPDYRILGGILTAGYGIFEILRSGKAPVDKKDAEDEKMEGRESLAGMLRVLLVTAALLGVVPMVSKLTVTEGAYGRMGDSKEARALNRYAWDHFSELYGYWPEDLKAALTDEEITACDKSTQQRSWILGRKVEEALGRERAREIYGEVAKAGKKVRARRNLKEMLLDAAGYGAAPLMHLYWMEGKTKASFSASNYEIMRMQAPRLTSVYVRYGGWFFAGACLISLALGIASFLRQNGRERFRILGMAIGFGVLGCFFVTHYVCRGGGIMDYKNVLPVTTFWATWALVTAICNMNGAQQ